MLDKNAILEALDTACKETILTAHQNLGKNHLAEHLAKAIIGGKFDAKFDDSSANDDLTEEKEKNIL